jgi:hypothetical protein
VWNPCFIQETPVELEASSIQVWLYGFNLDRIELVLGLGTGCAEVRDRREKLAAIANAFINGLELEGRFEKKEARLVRIDRWICERREPIANQCFNPLFGIDGLDRMIRRVGVRIGSRGGTHRSNDQNGEEKGRAPRSGRLPDRMSPRILSDLGDGAEAEQLS